MEERWIEGVSSFAVYFPATHKGDEAKRKGYQYTNQRGDFFVAEVEDEKNIEDSITKFISSCNQYFGSDYGNITECQNRLHEELLFVEESKNTLLSLAREAEQCGVKDEAIDLYLEKLNRKLEEKQAEISKIRQRVRDWENLYQKIPYHVRILRNTKFFAKRLQTEFRLFMNDEEPEFLHEAMTFDEIKEKYSHLYARCNQSLSEFKQKKTSVESIKNRYDDELRRLRQHNIHLHGEKEEKYRLELDYINRLLDQKHRYIAF